MTQTDSWLGRELELEIERVAHGGIFVARHQGRVVFVSHAAPGELVRVRVFEDRGGSFARAEVIEVLRPSEHRVTHFWKEARVGNVGGAEFGHLALAYQRQLKEQVIKESLERMANLHRDVSVQPVPGDDEAGGLGYRTRVQLQVSSAGVAGPYRERSHEVVPVNSLPLAVAEINELGLHLKNWQDVKRIEIAASSTGGIQYLVEQKVKGDKKLTERALGRSYRISSGGFWQVHKGAADLLASEVLNLLSEVEFEPQAANLDLYGGVGLFAGALSTRFGKNIDITSVEASKRATADAQANLVDLTKHKAVALPVETYLRSLVRSGGDAKGATVVLDPPRSGAGGNTIALLSSLAPRNIIYVACDPVSLARDLKSLVAAGYHLKEVRAYDLFPHTHHFETIASLVLS